MTQEEAFQKGLERGLKPYRKEYPKEVARTLNEPYEETEENKKKEKLKRKKKASRLLKKPKVKIQKLSATHLIQTMARQQGAVVRDVPNQYANPPQADRSLFFSDTFTGEKKVGRNWLFR